MRVYRRYLFVLLAAFPYGSLVPEAVISILAATEERAACGRGEGRERGRGGGSGVGGKERRAAASVVSTQTTHTDMLKQLVALH